MRKRHASRRGATTVELALVILLLLVIILGIIEFGRGVMVQQLLTNAARYGARQATLPGATTAQIKDDVELYLDNTTVRGASRVVEVWDKTDTPMEVANMPPKSPVVVVVTVPYDEVGFGLRRWLGGASLSAQAKMRREN